MITGQRCIASCSTTRMRGGNTKKDRTSCITERHSKDLREAGHHGEIQSQRSDELVQRRHPFWRSNKHTTAMLESGERDEPLLAE